MNYYWPTDDDFRAADSNGDENLTIDEFLAYDPSISGIDLFFQWFCSGGNKFHGSKDVRSRSFKAWTFQEIETFKLDLKEDELSSL